MEISLIKDGVAVEVSGTDVYGASSAQLQTLKELLHKHLVVVIKNQKRNPYRYTKLIETIGNGVANYSQMVHHTTGDRFEGPFVPTNRWNGSEADYPVQRVTGMKKNGERTGIFDTARLDWHANLNGLDRADGVALQGWEGCENTSTSFLNTNLAYNDLDPSLKKEIQNLYCEYVYSPETWAPGTSEKQLQYMKRNGNPPYKMWLIQENIAGVKGLYFYTNNKCKIITEDSTLYDRLYKHMFQDKYIYQHWWEPGDIVLMDQILTLHKRDQNEPEILAKRILHRVTFNISNVNGWLQKRNVI